MTKWCRRRKEVIKQDASPVSEYQWSRAVSVERKIQGVSLKDDSGEVEIPGVGKVKYG